MAKNVKAGETYVEISSRDKRLRAGLHRAQARLRAFAAAARAAGKRAGRAMNALSSSLSAISERAKAAGASLLKIGAAAALPLAYAAKRFASFDDAMKAVKAITGAVGKDFERLEQQARDLGATTSFTAKEAAEGMVLLGRAGFNVAEIMKSIPGVLDLARATGTEIGEAAEIAGQALRAFGLDASQMTNVVDTLTATANNSAQGLSDIGEAMKYVAPLARAAGEDMKQTAAAIGLLANQGIKGSAAGTALARAYKNLGKENIAQKLRDKFGIEVANAAGDLRPVADIIAEIGQKTKDLGSQKRIAIFDELFGRGAVASQILANSKAFDVMKNKLGEVDGEAKRTAQTMDSGLGGAFRILLSAVDDVVISVGKALEPLFTDWAEAAQNAANQISAFIKQNPGLISSIAKMVPVVAGIGAGFVALGIAIGPLAGAFSLVGTVISITTGIIGAASLAVGTLITGFGLLLTPIGLVTAGVGTLAGYLITAAADGSEFANGLKADFAGLKNVATRAFSGIADALKSGDIQTAAEILFAGLKVIWHTGLGVLREIWSRFVRSLERTGGTITATIETAVYDAATSVDNFISAVTPDALYEPNVLAKKRAKYLLEMVEKRTEPSTALDLGGYEKAEKAKQELRKLLSAQALKKKRDEQLALRQAASEAGGTVADQQQQRKDELLARQSALEKRLKRQQQKLDADLTAQKQESQLIIESARAFGSSDKTLQLEKQLSAAVRESASQPIFGGFDTFSLRGFQAQSANRQEKIMSEQLREQKKSNNYLKYIKDRGGQVFA